MEETIDIYKQDPNLTNLIMISLTLENHQKTINDLNEFLKDLEDFSLNDYIFYKSIDNKECLKALNAFLSKPTINNWRIAYDLLKEVPITIFILDKYKNSIKSLPALWSKKPLIFSEFQHTVNILTEGSFIIVPNAGSSKLQPNDILFYNKLQEKPLQTLSSSNLPNLNTVFDEKDSKSVKVNEFIDFNIKPRFKKSASESSLMLLIGAIILNLVFLIPYMIYVKICQEAINRNENRMFVRNVTLNILLMVFALIPYVITIFVNQKHFISLTLLFCFLLVFLILFSLQENDLLTISHFDGNFDGARNSMFLFLKVKMVNLCLIYFCQVALIVMEIFSVTNIVPNIILILFLILMLIILGIILYPKYKNALKNLNRSI